MSDERGSAPTGDSLRSAIDSGRTGDKVPVSDPAAAPLGADAEAGGVPPTPWGRVRSYREVLAGVVQGFAASPPGADREALRLVLAMAVFLAGNILIAALVAASG